MRQLGEQWIEEIDGKQHMVKAVERETEKQFDCSGCFYNDTNGRCSYHSQDCPIGYVAHGYIKDLGPVNEEGCLPAPWDKNLYPNIDNCIIDGKDTGWDIYIDCPNIDMGVNAKTFEQAIDLWNSRV